MTDEQLAHARFARVLPLVYERMQCFRADENAPPDDESAVVAITDDYGTVIHRDTCPRYLITQESANDILDDEMTLDSARDLGELRDALRRAVEHETQNEGWALPKAYDLDTGELVHYDITIAVTIHLKGDTA